MDTPSFKEDHISQIPAFQILQKMGELEKILQESLNRNQIKYLTGKLFEYEVLSKSGKGSGTTYTVHESFSLLKGDSLTQKVIAFLSSKYGQDNSPNIN